MVGAIRGVLRHLSVGHYQAVSQNSDFGMAPDEDPPGHWTLDLARRLVLGVFVLFVAAVAALVGVVAWQVATAEELQCVVLPGSDSGGARVTAADSGCSPGQVCLFREARLFRDKVRVTDCGPER
jgi:hypothetical protein